MARHAHATKVVIRLKADAHFLCLEVEDNGNGIDESEIADPQSLGLLGMRERAIALRGEVRFLGVRGKGTSVIARVPLMTGGIQRTTSARRTDYKKQHLAGRNETQNTAEEGPRA